MITRRRPSSLQLLLPLLASIGVLLLSSSSSLLPLVVNAIEVGDKVPMTDDIVFHYGFPPEIITLSSRLVPNKNVLIVGLPGAFTPT